MISPFTAKNCQASVRREHFGGLLYRHDTRRLYVLRSGRFLDLVYDVERGRPLRQALDDFACDMGRTEAGDAPRHRALAQLRALGMVRPDHASTETVGQTKLTSTSPKAGDALLSETLQAPICLTWEITSSCNLSCRHCLSASGRRRSDELTTSEAKRLIDEWAAMKVFYVNVGGGEPMMREDFFELMDYALDQRIGIKFSTNGAYIDDHAAGWIASRDYLDVQISLDGASSATNDPVRGAGTYFKALQAMHRLAARGFPFKINTVVTLHNYAELDELYAMAVDQGAQLRLSRLRPSGRGRDTWEQLRPSADQNHGLYEWLLAHPKVLTGDSFFHLSAYGRSLEGLNACSAGRLVCCVDPTGEVYACPFLLEPSLAWGNVRARGFADIWHAHAQNAYDDVLPGDVCAACGVYARCHGGCVAAKLGSGCTVDAPDPDCILLGQSRV